MRASACCSRAVCRPSEQKLDGAIERADDGIINADERSVDLYLNTVRMLWKLGPKEIVEPETPEQELPD
jgi:hypothetical protein